MSDSSSESDSEEYLLRFANHNRAKTSQSKPAQADPLQSSTAAFAKAQREVQRAAAAEKKRKSLFEQTLLNFSAASVSVDDDAGPSTPSDQTDGNTKLDRSSVQECLEQADVLAEKGDTREAIVCLIQGLQVPNNGKEQKMGILRKLAKAYADIGRLQDAHDCRSKIRQLSGKEEQKPVATSSIELPEELKASIDQAIELSISGSFGALEALHFAYREGRGAVGLLDVMNHQHTKTKATALMSAAAKGNTAMIQKLLDAGADVSLAAADGSTALYWAGNFDQPEVAKLLLSHGALVGTLETEGWSERVLQVVNDFDPSMIKRVAVSAVPKQDKIHQKSKEEIVERMRSLAKQE